MTDPLPASPGRLHIHRPSSTRYVVRVRPRGYRKWRVLPIRHRSFTQAAQHLARAFTRGGHHRGEILLTADYYDPLPIVEMVRR